MKYLKGYKLPTIHALFVALLLTGSISVGISVGRSISFVQDEPYQILPQPAVPSEHIVARPFFIDSQAASNAWQAQRALLQDLRVHNVTRNLRDDKHGGKNASKPPQQGLPSLDPAPVW